MSFDAETGIYHSPYSLLPHFPLRPTWSAMMEDNPYSFVPDPARPGKGVGKLTASSQGQRHADRIALTDAHSKRTYTYLELQDLTLRLGAGLLEGARLKRGQVVLLALIPNVEMVIIYLACQAAGLIVAGSNPLYTPSEVKHVVKLTNPDMIITTKQFLQTFSCLDEGKSGGPRPKMCFADGHAADKDSWTDRGNAVWALQNLIDDEPKALKQRLEQIGGLSKNESYMDEPNGYFFSSGTTGLPKAVVHTHRSTWSQIRILLSCPGFTSLDSQSWTQEMRLPSDGYIKPGPNEMVTLTLPLFHVGGASSLWGTLARGDHGLLLAPFDMQLFVKSISDLKIQRGGAVPPIILGMLRSGILDKYSLKSLTRFVTGAAPIGPDLQKEAAKRFGCPLLQVYGASETAGVATHTSHLDPAGAQPGSCGRPVPGVEFRIVEHKEHGSAGVRDLGPMKDGEVWIRGPIIMSGYLNNDEATRESFAVPSSTSPIDIEDSLDDAESAEVGVKRGSDGHGRWYKTGDIGHFTPDGFLFITDRAKELIKYKGFQVAPAELEDVLISHPDLADACVIGVWSEKESTELPRAYVVRKAGCKLSDEQLTESVAAFVAERVTAYKKLRGGIRFLDAVPKSVSGKILRKQVRDLDKKLGNESVKAKL